jgi:thiol:disulfide interchange protein DsbA
MRRRDFSLACGSVIAAGTLVLPVVQAKTAPVTTGQEKKPQAGEDYQVLDKRVAVDAPSGKIEVIEFFWYNCSHCNAFEPLLDAWSKRLPKDVVVRRMPVSFRDDFEPQQRLYFALEAMGLVDKLHAKVFAAIHGEKLNLSKADAITDWVVKQGVDKAKFLEQYNSFSASTKATRAKQLQNAYRVEGVPALGVAGQFYTDGTLAKSMERALQVVDFLVAGVRSGK